MEIDKDVIDKLLAGYKGPHDSDRRVGAAKAANQGVGRAGDERRADPSPGLREARRFWTAQRQLAQRRQPQAAEVRFRGSGDRGAAGPKRHLYAAIVPPHRRRFTGFDDKILSMYAMVELVSSWPSATDCRMQRPCYAPSSLCKRTSFAKAAIPPRSNQPYPA